MNLKLGLIVASLSLACVGSAQLLGLKGRVGYTTTANFDLTGGGSGQMQGLELGFDVPIFRLGPLMDISLSPSVMMGGSLASGGDVDGNVYRFMLTTRPSLPMTGFYAIGGVGIGHTQSRGNQFNDVSGYQIFLGGGAPLKLLPVISTSLEVGYYASNRGQLRGLNIGIAASF